CVVGVDAGVGVRARSPSRGGSLLRGGKKITPPPTPPPPQQNSSSPAPRSSNTTSTTGLFFFAGLAGGFGLATGATGTTGTTGASDGIVTTAEHDGHFARVPPSWSGTCDVKPQCRQV